MNIYERMNDIILNGIPAALATIIKTEGSTPRGVGTKMLVEGTQNPEIFGSVGGGAFEHAVIKAAVDVIKKGAPTIFQYDLTKIESGMVCGGVADVFIEQIGLAEKIVILGVGHVGKAIARVLKAIDFSFVMIDHRESAKEYMKDVENIDLRIANYDEFTNIVNIDDRTYIIISTASHNLDMICLRQSMKTRAKYIGMLASKSKRAEVYEKLNNLKVFPEKDKRVFCPVGIKIDENTPSAIAISIISQIYQVKTHTINIETPNGKK